MWAALLIGRETVRFYKVHIKHLLDEAESNIRFVLPEQVMMGEAKLSLTSVDPAKLI